MHKKSELKQDSVWRSLANEKHFSKAVIITGALTAGNALI